MFATVKIENVVEVIQITHTETYEIVWDRVTVIHSLVPSFADPDAWFYLGI